MDEKELNSLVEAWCLAIKSEDRSRKFKENQWAIEKVSALSDRPEDLWNFILAVYVRPFSVRVSSGLADGPMKELHKNHRDAFIDRVEELRNRDGRLHHILPQEWRSEITNRIWSRLESTHGKPWKERPVKINDSLIDNFVFLLSSDFFFNLWEMLDLKFGDDDKQRIQLGSRSIVKQIVHDAGDELDYYLTSFAEGRIAETYTLLLLLFKGVENSEFEETVIYKILTEEHAYEEALSFFTMLLLSIANNYEVELDMATDLKIKLGRIWKEVDVCTYDDRFDVLIEASNSDWDQYLKSLTSDDPEFLSITFEQFLSFESYKMFCKKLRIELSKEEIEIVRESFSKYLLSVDRQLDPQKVFM